MELHLRVLRHDPPAGGRGLRPLAIPASNPTMSETTMDNVIEAPAEAGVGSKKLFENDKVIVWDFVLPAGQETPVHMHNHSYMWFAVQGAPLQIYDEHGNDVGLFPVPTDGVFELKVEGDTIEVMSDIGKGVKVPSKHKAKNVGNETYREILVEWK